MATDPNTAIVASQAALDRLNRSLTIGDSLDDLVQARTRRSLLLVDCSGSMADRIRSGERKIDALRKVVTDITATARQPLAAFGVRCHGQVEVVDTVPEPQGGTPIDLAILFGKAQGATHLVIVTDGEANDSEAAYRAAETFGGTIDTFYIGNGGDSGARFAKTLAEMTGGTAHLTDLGKPKELAGKLTLALGNGADII